MIQSSNPFDAIPKGQILDILLMGMTSFSPDDMAQRNGFITSGKRGLAELVVSKAESLLSEFRLAATALNPMAMLPSLLKM
ncbi:hypothetical protein Q3G72_019544 [Acer saccharum]|nr:hypothetical protein Q3G72_019544 [Acer saccharum]